MCCGFQKNRINKNLFADLNFFITFAPRLLEINTDLWCNGNTPGFGPGVQGSSPCRSTKA